MKTNKLYYPLIAIFSCFILTVFSQENKSNYLVLVEDNSREEVACFHIELSENISDSIISNLIEFYDYSLDDDYRSILFNWYDEMDIFGFYSYRDKVNILSDLLLFRDDRRCSNKTYMIRPGCGKPIRFFENFTIQIEALYTFTRMLMYHVVKAVPELIDIETGETINNNQEKVNEVYEIYKQWLIENEKTGFKNYRLPLYGTKYKWKNQDLFMDNFIGKELGNPKGDI